jgi:hypothetical protein
MTGARSGRHAHTTMSEIYFIVAATPACIWYPGSRPPSQIVRWMPGEAAGMQQSRGRTTGSRSLSLPTSTVSRMAPPVRDELHPDPEGATAGTPVVRASMASAAPQKAEWRFRRLKGSGQICPAAAASSGRTSGAGEGEGRVPSAAPTNRNEPLYLACLASEPKETNKKKQKTARKESAKKKE